MPPSNLLLASKITVTREPPQIRNIQGVPTAIAAFAGTTLRGPILTPTFVTSFAEFVEEFGGFFANGDLPLAIEGFFRNGGTAAWISRVVHYTDINNSGTSTAVKSSLDLNDRGGAAGPAVLDSVDGPFELASGEVLEVNIDAAGADTLTFTAASASTTTATETYALSNGMTLVYRVNSPGNQTLSELRTITFLTADFSVIGTATAAEVAAVINRDGIGISAEVVAGPAVTIRSDSQGSAASLVLDASSTSLAALSLSAGTNNGSGNVADIYAVTATEIAGLLTALPLSSGTATVSGAKVRLTSTGTGLAATVVITASTTASGIFAGVLPITQTGINSAISATLRITGKHGGAWPESGWSVEILAASSGESDRFNLRFKEGTTVRESFPNLSMDSGDDRYAEDFISDNSTLFDALDLASPATSPADLPAIGEFSSFAGGDDGLTGLADSDYTGSQAGGTGLFAFDLVNNITMLAIPGRTTSAVHNAMISYCEVDRVGLCFAFLDPPEALDEQGIKTYVETTAAIGGLTELAAICWPRVKILNPSTAIFGTASQITIPPSGHWMGMVTRTDADLGVFEPPANVEKGILFGVLGFETDDVLDERKRDVVYPVRINPITAIDGSPRHVDGSRTLKGDGNFPSISESRFVIFVSATLKTGLLFAKHRNNDRRLRQEVKRSIQAFLLQQFNAGAFRGDTPAESFFVDVSDALNPPEEVAAGKLNIRIGLATQRPAEFIVVKITQDTRELEERLATLGG